MTFIFYMMTFLISISAIPVVTRWISIYKRYSILEKYSMLTGKRFTFESSDFKVAWYVIVYYLIILISFIGLLSSNWFLFLSILILSMSSHFISKKIKSNKVKNYILGFLFTVSTCIMMFIPINHFHLGINVLEELKNYLY